MNVLLDNTCGDNKNNWMIFFLAWLVLTNVCEEASFFCMMVGHTYSRIDRTFSSLIGHMYTVSIYTATQLCHYIFLFLAPYKPSRVTELHCLWDWKAFFAPHVHGFITGFATGQFGSGMHEFLLRKDKNGVVRLYMRKSSAASTWLPEGEGYPIFSSTPEGHPGLATPHPEHKWGRAEVEQTVRAWFRYMFVSQAESQRIRDEWQTRFNALPTDNDIDQLSDGLKLKWADLPQRDRVPRQQYPGDRVQVGGSACRTHSCAPPRPRVLLGTRTNP